MKKIVILIIISFFLFGCKVKKTIKNETKEVEQIESISKTETTDKSTVSEVKKEELKQVKTENKTEEKKEVEITGKAEENKPLTYYNVVDGDTIDLFKVTGNADVIFKSSYNSQNSSLNSNSTTNTENTKESEKSISNAVENVKNTIKQVQNKSVEVVKRDFQFGTYLVFFIWGIVIIVVLGLIFYLRKSNFLGGIWEKLNNKI
jgi:hypothetical protein